MQTEVETGRNRPQPSIGGVSRSGNRQEGPSLAACGQRVAFLTPRLGPSSVVLFLVTVAPGHWSVCCLEDPRHCLFTLQMQDFPRGETGMTKGRERVCGLFL